MLKYWIWLATRKGLGSRSIYLLARYFPSPEAIYFADAQTYASFPWLQKWDSLLDKDLEEAETLLRKCYELGILPVTMQDAAYPKRLLTLDDPPVILYCKGSLPDLNGPVIGVVGTRDASMYGLQQARRMGYGLSRCGGIVVSGGARGIDTEVLRGALSGGNPVIAVLGNGVDVVYPRENAGLFRDVINNGCLISEYPPGTMPLRSRFPVRNRIISGISMGVLVVEAPEQSGALITAHRALDQGRDVYALPANVGQPSGSGNLQLLRDGATLVRDPWEILQEYEGQFPNTIRYRDHSNWERVPEEKKETPPPTPPMKKDIDKGKATHYIDAKKIMDTLTPEEQQMVLLLEPGDVHIDTLSEQLQQTAGDVLGVLTMLEMRGLIKRLSGRRFSLAETE